MNELTRVSKTNFVHVIIPKKIFQIQTELTNQLWEEYWSDWVNIGVIHDNDTVFEFAPDSEEAESRFLSFLHQEFRSGNYNV